MLQRAMTDVHMPQWHSMKHFILRWHSHHQFLVYMTVIDNSRPNLENSVED